MPGESKTSKRRLAARDRWLAALELRKKGWTFERIAEELGYAGRQAAFKAVMDALKEAHREPADEMRSLEAARLDDLMESLWEDIGPEDVAVVDRILRIMERRARLLGLDMPSESKVDHTIKGPLIIREGKSKEESDE